MARSSDPSAQNAGRAFLASSVLGALNTSNARSPLSRQGLPQALCFFPGWLTSELPLHAAGWQAAATAAFARKGALRTFSGAVGLGISLGSWATLIRIYQEGARANEVFDQALALGLGLPVAGTGEGRGTQAPLTRRQLLLGPVSNPRRRYVARNGPKLSYGEAGRRNRLDVWKKADLPADGKAPVLLQVHGGGWVIGNKNQQAMPLMSHLCDQGWVCVSINYRLSPRATWPDHIVDVKRALAWVKGNIADHGGDPDFVAITGGSAGGHLSSLAALTPNEPMFQPGFEEADTSVVAAVPFYGVYDFINRDVTGSTDMEDFLARVVMKTPLSADRKLWEEASTMSWVRPDAPPFMIVHGANDSLVPVAQARSFAHRLGQESKSPVVYVELPGAQHAFEVFNSVRSHHAVLATTRFLETIRARRHEESPGLPSG